MKDKCDFSVKVSEKLVFLNKLLLWLRDDTLDIIEDYLNLHSLKYKQIDSYITGHKCQNTINRFQVKCDRRMLLFVMILSTRASSIGTNLTAVDTVIMFDYDWNSHE